ncbi:MAG: cbb3-type cytochrome c oxidase N-terminal domain-containing protein [Planctomycetota bacterium]
MIARDENINDRADKQILGYDDFVKRTRDNASKPSEPKVTAEDAEGDWAFEHEYYDRVRARQAALEEQQTSPAEYSAITDELTDHNYDGIQEYDNPTPGWWYMIFFACVVFSLGYVFIYHMSTMIKPLADRHHMAEAIALQEQFAELSQLEAGDEKIVRIMNEEVWLDQGKAVFIKNCALCHTAEGNGSVGPNLTDEIYKNVTSLAEITELVITGTPDQAMPAHRTILNENEIALVTAYVASLRGQNLPTNEIVTEALRVGEEIPPWPTLDENGNLVQTPSSN